VSQNDAQVSAQRALEFGFLPISAIAQCVACCSGHFLRISIAFVRFFFFVVNEIFHAGFFCFVFKLTFFVLITIVVLWA
jgi:glucan phosphoethanolaminetransferase (alkaline phosphatase superfamily)